MNRTLPAFANRDVWYFSNNGGASAYQFQNGDYFNASFSLTVDRRHCRHRLEAGFLFSNPSGGFGGDLQSIVMAVMEWISKSEGLRFTRSPPLQVVIRRRWNVPNYVLGPTYNMGLNYDDRPEHHHECISVFRERGVRRVRTWRHLLRFGRWSIPSAPGDYLGGYFQTQTVIVPEPSTFALLGLGFLPLVRLFRRRA